MEKNSVWTMVLVSAVVAVISSLATLFFVGNPSLAPRAVIDANSCTADAVCETSAVVVTGSNPATSLGLEVLQGAKFGNLGVGGQVGGGIYVDGSQVVFNSPVTNGIQVTGSINSQPGIGLDVSSGAKFGNLAAGSQVGGGLYVDGSQVLARSPITAVSLAGTSNAFVCVSSVGLLYRSTTAC